MFDIKRFRRERRMTQSEFASQVGYSRTAISNMETGSHTVSDNFLNKMEDVFGLELSKYKNYGRKPLMANDRNPPPYIPPEDWQKKFVELMIKNNDLLTEQNELLQQEIKVLEARLREKENR